MSRIGFAFSSFFNVLFRGQLPGDAAAFLPAPEPAPPVPTAAAPAPALPAPVAAPGNAAELRTEGALVLLSLFQREGRLLDFLRESLDGHDDAAIGAAVRAIHRGCKKVLDEHVEVAPVMPGEEEAPITVPRGFDPGEISLIGTTGRAPPFQGTLIHHGWRATKVRFPILGDGVDRRVLAPAEVRVS